MTRTLQITLGGLIAAAGIMLGALGHAAADDPQAPAMSEYQIGQGDVLEISVWKNPDLTKSVIVLPDGKISFPLIGQTIAAGKTVDQLNAELRRRLTRYVPEVDLSIIVAQVNSMTLYVIGRVNNPGRFLVNTNVTVMQALAMAGGLNAFAKQGAIKIFHGGQSREYLRFDYDEVSKGVHTEQNVLLQRGDLIVVP